MNKVPDIIPYEIKNKKGFLFIVIVIAVVCVLIWFIHRANKQKQAISNFFEYEGDNYSGTYSYIGDKESLNEGRQSAYSAKTFLFKITEPANILKYERNAKGDYTMMQTGRKLKKGSQIKILDDTLRTPLTFHGKNFVQSIKGEWVRMDKINKV